MPSVPDLSEEEFDLIAATLGVTDKGRAFLRMHAERSRSCSIDDLRVVMREELREQLGVATAGAEHIHAEFLRKELQEMSACIAQARTEIASLVPSETGNNRIIAATGELDAIVSATERATTAILTAAERVQALAEALPDQEDLRRVRTDIESEVTEILMACSFQDITGQRTSKVVNTLRYIEQRVHAMVDIWGTDGEGVVAKRTPSSSVDDREDAHLLNGPALEGGVSQDDIDAMFGGDGTDQNAAAESATEVREGAEILADGEVPSRKKSPSMKKTREAAERDTPPAAGPADDGAVLAFAASETASQDDIDALFA